MKYYIYFYIKAAIIPPSQQAITNLHLISSDFWTERVHLAVGWKQCWEGIINPAFCQILGDRKDIRKGWKRRGEF